MEKYLGIETVELKSLDYKSLYEIKFISNEPHTELNTHSRWSQEFLQCFDTVDCDMKSIWAVKKTHTGNPKGSSLGFGNLA